ncbi:hypothetical protein CWB99_19375 [Pseudoalteromonas rubra]|uniref:Uncharacterized protein n=1 Tax=Pseudoalteromonas rubra TaxID=43658 RepID=A0A5S3WHS9_9GAMM|nr:hypothetical protein [Pseudoalteromonas rubra]TMP26144.1 hypothetical protein CWB99_19375 [Pseudoalteromonas rubra]TMP32947.1 hypothetical protein CWC00_11355 [Pseudoalteromonas rubra]
MTVLLYIAAVLLILVSLAHSYLGERFILIRLFKRDNLPQLFGSSDFTIRTLRFAWHLTSIAWLGFAALLLALASPEFTPTMLLLIIAATFVLHSALALFLSRGKHCSWLLFAVVSVLLIVAER